MVHFLSKISFVKACVRMRRVWASHSISYNRMSTVWGPYECCMSFAQHRIPPYDHRVLPFSRYWTRSNTIRIRLYTMVIRSCEIVIRLSANLIRHSCGAMRFLERARPCEIFLNISKPRVRFLAVCERHTVKDGWTRSTTKRYESVIRCSTTAWDFQNLTRSCSKNSMWELGLILIRNRSTCNDMKF